MMKIYEDWAGAEDWREKRDANSRAYDALTDKYDVMMYVRGNKPSEKELEKADVVIVRTPQYGRSSYVVPVNKPELRKDELALLCDRGNLCFGYMSRGDTIIVFED